MLEVAIQFLMNELPLIKLLFDALNAGVNRQMIVDSIKAQMTALSDEKMHRELDRTVPTLRTP